MSVAAGPQIDCPVCVLAGGLGTRLHGVRSDIPKPLVPVAGKPFLFHQLQQLSDHGARQVVLSVGHFGEKIEAAVGDGRQFGLEVAYSYDGPELIGTAAAVRLALPLLGERFLVIYGDVYLRLPFGALAQEPVRTGLPAVMAVFRNIHQWDTSNVDLRDGMVRYNKSNPSPDMEWIDYGVAAVTGRAFDVTPDAADLAMVYQTLSERGELGGFIAEHRFFEIGTPKGLAATEKFLTAGQV